MSKNFDRKSDGLVNEEIRAKEILLIAADGEKLGKMTPEQGLKIAREANLDLVCVAPNAPVPVCRLMDYSKFRYEQQRKAREAKKNQKVVSLKEIWISPSIGQHDLETKVRNGQRFLEGGHKLKVTLRIRSMRMLNLGTATDELLYQVADMLSDYGVIEQEPKQEGRNFSMIMAPIKKK